MRFFLKILLAIIALYLAATIIFVSSLSWQGPLSEESNVFIAKGMGSKEIGETLENTGVIKYAATFRPAVLFLGGHGKLKAGEYKFPAGISLKEIVNKMVKGDVVIHSVTVPEGLTVHEILAIIKSEPSLSGEITIKPKEGELLPETYHFYYGYTRDEMVKRMMEDRTKVMNELWPKRSAALLLKSPDEAIILASIVEKETRIKEERPRVAGVYLNRVKKNMLLQADPTVIYAITKGEREMGRLLTFNDLKFDSPYNTYVYGGLPPGPIGNPGKASIEAALNPEITEDLYFVADGAGGHLFAKTLNEHNANVAKYRRISKEKQASAN